MKSSFFHFVTSMVVLLCSMCLVSCGEDDEEEYISPQDQEMINKLSGTSWKYYKQSYIQSSGTVKYKDIDKNRKITFANDGTLYFFDLDKNEYGRDVFTATWTVKDGVIINKREPEYSSREIGYLLGAIGLGIPWTILSLSSSELIVDDDVYIKYFSRTSYTEGPSSGSGSSSGSMEFVNFTFTATQSSVTVKFYTSERAKNATIKYGLYSANTSVSGVEIANKQISATIKGLSRGTKYYVKCTAYYDGGSITSDEYPVITNY